MVPAALSTSLRLLGKQLIWTVQEAETELGSLAPLVKRGEIRAIHTEAGPGVVLGPVGRRRVGVPSSNHMAPSIMADLLYVRLAAQHHGWTITKMPSRTHGSRSGQLDRLAVATREGQPVRLLACCVNGGYARRTVLTRFQFLRSSLLGDGIPLIVVSPHPRRLASLRNHDVLLEIVHYPVP